MAPHQSPPSRPPGPSGPSGPSMAAAARDGWRSMLLRMHEHARLKALRTARNIILAAAGGGAVGGAVIAAAATGGPSGLVLPGAVLLTCGACAAVTAWGVMAMMSGRQLELDRLNTLLDLDANVARGPYDTDVTRTALWRGAQPLLPPDPDPALDGGFTW